MLRSVWSSVETLRLISKRCRKRSTSDYKRRKRVTSSIQLSFLQKVVPLTASISLSSRKVPSSVADLCCQRLRSFIAIANHQAQALLMDYPITWLELPVHFRLLRARYFQFSSPMIISLLIIKKKERRNGRLLQELWDCSCPKVVGCQWLIQPLKRNLNIRAFLIHINTRKVREM